MQLALPFDVQLPAIFVRHRRARRYIIRVAGGQVRVTIPRGGSRREAEQFLATSREWIEREVRAREPWRPSPFAAAETRTKAAGELPARLAELAAAHGLTVVRVSVRNQRHRWGSCSPRGHICLNWRLVRVPPAVRDYVMIHELMHLKRLDHSPRFWRLVERACHDYRTHRRWLREHEFLLDDG